MKNAKVFRLSAALVLLMFALIWAQLAIAQQDDDPAAPMAQQQLDSMNQQQTGAMGQPLDTKTFAGKILKSGDKLELQDGIGESTYQLDDQKQAQGFEGKNVRVTGTMDLVTRTIHVIKIELER
jgi:hypothetical protein